MTPPGRRLGRLPTLLAAGLVAGIAAAAVVDALRARAPEPAGTTAGVAPGPQPLDSSVLAEALRDAGAYGVLVTSDSACRVAGLHLPELDPVPVPGRACRLAPSGGRLALDGRLASPADPSRLARCHRGLVEILAGSERAAAARVERAGCALAWKPDGTLTSIADGELVALDPAGRSLRPRVLLSRAELARIFRPGLPPGDRAALELVEVVWPTDERVLAVLRKALEPEYLFGSVERGRLVTWRCCFEHLRGLRLSPTGRHADVRSEHGALVFTATGAFVPLPWSEPPVAVAWSPDDNLLAAARARSLEVAAAGAGMEVVAELPLAVRDVAWRPAPLDLVPGDEP